MSVKSVGVRMLLACLLITGVLTEPGTGAQDVRSVTYSPHAARANCWMNMGPTGARAWMRGYDLVVTEIDLYSPAAGILEPADVVIAADGRTFGPEQDPRMALGDAIGRAEATGGPLVLTVLRDGKEATIQVPLRQRGAWAESWPTGCEKSRGILNAACLALLHDQIPSGSILSNGNIATTMGGLLMLSNPEPRFLDGARRAAYAVADAEYAFASIGNNWSMGYGGLLLAEYFLATGDDAVLPGLQDIVDLLVRGQMRCGGWGHTSPAGAYGALNQIGITCAITLTLARECGLDVPQESLDRAHAFFARFAELGAVPYGDHLPHISLDNNGVNASAAVLMRLAGRPQEAAAFSSSVAMSYFEREEGHTGGFFSMIWGPLAAAMTEPEELRTFLDYQKWYYDLIRTWRGELVLLPYHEALTRFDSSSYIGAGGSFTSGGMGLVFALPYRRLRILGAPASAFSPNTEMHEALQQIRASWVAREWTTSDALLDALTPAALSGEHDRHILDQFLAARDYRRQATTALLNEMESNLDNRAAYRAHFQYEALKRSLGEDLDDRFAEMDKRMADAEGAMASGKRMYDAYEDLSVLSFLSWVPYGPRAKELTAVLPSLRVPIWEPLSPVSSVTRQTWRTWHLQEGEAKPQGWTELAFDDSTWLEHAGIVTQRPGQTDDMDEAAAAIAREALAGSRPLARRIFHVSDPKGDALRIRLQTVRPAQTKVYLNGVLIVDAVRGQRGGYAVIPLDASALGLLAKGENVLAVSSTSYATGNNHLDAGLEICRALHEIRPRVPIRNEAMVIEAGREFDDTLRVRETRDKARRALQDAHHEKTLPELVRMLGQSVALQRRMAEEALVAKGKEGIAAAAAVLEAPDWKVRSAACDVIAGAAGRYGNVPDGEEMALVVHQVPALIRLLEDEHVWVQVRAAIALRSIGDPARGALPVLVKLVQHEHEWVRTEALASLEQLAPDAETELAAAMASLHLSDTAFRGTRIAYNILRAHPVEGDGRLQALAATLRNLPDGMGGRTLIRPMLEYAVSLDPKGRVLIPILLTAARDKELRYSRQQANPREKVIELLAGYGDKARAQGAIAVLREVLASDDRHDVAQHATARQALLTLGVEVPEAE